MNIKLACMLVCALVAMVRSAAKNDVEARRFLFDCDYRCTHGGCYGQEGRCLGACYCYGSGYEYRCRSCDL
ncbi:hypothetical protein DPMN_141107 [Dreissena polymorpha]|uniref:Defensin n=1 Tax=Dreissena polymorpha TaxID=45954 RepID=A0A9D4GBP8_DREPO|nr:hypothetical protein DPMN_141107 [Dreissena polymorpha]